MMYCDERFGTSTDSRFLPLVDWFDDGESPPLRYQLSSIAPKWSLSAFPGVAITELFAENERQRRGLCSVLMQFLRFGEITQGSLGSSLAFIQCLPRYKRLPKVAPDGEGGVTMAWEVAGRGRTLITISDGVAYAVTDAGTPQATYLQDSPVSSSLIEDRILDIIPG